MHSRHSIHNRGRAMPFNHLYSPPARVPPAEHESEQQSQCGDVDTEDDEDEFDAEAGCEFFLQGTK